MILEKEDPVSLICSLACADHGTREEESPRFHLRATHSYSLSARFLHYSPHSIHFPPTFPPSDQRLGTQTQLAGGEEDQASSTSHYEVYSLSRDGQVPMRHVRGKPWKANPLPDSYSDP